MKSTETSFRTDTLKGALVICNVISAIIGVATAIPCAIQLQSLYGWHFASCLIGIAAGVVPFVSCFLAYYGGKRESLGLLWTCFSAIAIVMLVQLGLLVFEFAYDVNEISTDMIEQLWLNKMQNPAGMASVEKDYYCCGRNGAKDYVASNLRIPESCYQNGIPSKHPFYYGCVFQMINNSGYILGQINETVFWLTVFEVLTLYFGVKLAATLRRKNNVFTIKKNLYAKILLAPELGKVEKSILI